MILPPPPASFRPHRPRGRARIPLALVSAACDDAPALTLAFDRAVDVSRMDVSLIRVDNGVLGFSYVGHETPVRVGPTIVQILLTGIDDYTGPGVILTAAAGNGIVASDGGMAWAGVTDLSLPFA